MGTYGVTCVGLCNEGMLLFCSMICVDNGVGWCHHIKALLV